MPWFNIVWDYEPGGNIAHLAEYGVTSDEAEEVADASRKSRAQPLQ